MFNHFIEPGSEGVSPVQEEDMVVAFRRVFTIDVVGVLPLYRVYHSGQCILAVVIDVCLFFLESCPPRSVQAGLGTIQTATMWPEAPRQHVT